MNNAPVAVMKWQHSLAVICLLSTLVLFLSGCHWRFISALVKCSCHRITSTVQQSMLQLLTVTLQPCLPCWHCVNTLCAGYSTATCTGAVELKCTWGHPLQLTCGSAKERIVLHSMKPYVTGIVSDIGKSQTVFKSILEPLQVLRAEEGIQEVVSVNQSTIQMALVTCRCRHSRNQKCFSVILSMWEQGASPDLSLPEKSE